MADNPNPDLDLPETTAPAEKIKRKGIKRRIFLAGSALVVGGGIFGVWWTDSSVKAKGNALIGGEGKPAFGSILTIAEDDTVTVFSPHFASMVSGSWIDRVDVEVLTTSVCSYDCGCRSRGTAIGKRSGSGQASARLLQYVCAVHGSN